MDTTDTVAHSQEERAGFSESDAGPEFNILVEWERLQHACLTTFLPQMRMAGCSPRAVFSQFVRQSTRRQVHIRWGDISVPFPATVDRTFELCLGTSRYGTLGFNRGYLASTLLPSIPYLYARLCTLLLSLAEREAVFSHQAARLPPLPVVVEVLSPREREILQSLALGEDEAQTSARLSITPKTVRAHRHRLYQRLNVHDAHDAVLRGFLLRLYDALSFAPAFAPADTHPTRAHDASSTRTEQCEMLLASVPISRH